MNDEPSLRSLDSLLKNIVESRAKAYLDRELKWIEEQSDTNSLKRDIEKIFSFANEKIRELEDQARKLEIKLAHLDALNELLQVPSIKKTLDKIAKRLQKEDEREKH